MLKKIIAVIFTAAASQSCSADLDSNHKIAFTIGNGAKSLLSSRYYDEPSIVSKKDIIKLNTLEWFEPYEVKNKDGLNISIKNCSQFLDGKNQFSEIQPSEYSTFRYYLMHCLIIEKIINSKDSGKSFLPKQIVNKESPKKFPKEFISVVSKSEQEALDAMPPSARWADGVKITDTIDLGNNRLKFSQDEQEQILSEIARADFNGDGLEDALVYLRTTLNGGSWESDQIFTITAGEDGVIRTLDIYPTD